jgi:hypothetical protein
MVRDNDDEVITAKAYEDSYLLWARKKVYPKVPRAEVAIEVAPPDQAIAFGHALAEGAGHSELSTELCCPAAVV